MSFRIVKPAETAGATTLKVVKEELADQVAGFSDKMIKRLIARASGEIAAYLNVPAANDGSMSLGVETIEEKFSRSPWFRGGSKNLVLSRRPVISIESVVIGDTTIDDVGYELDGAAGILKRAWLPETSLSVSAGAQTIVTYKAGWTLPGDDDDFTMPPQIESAALSMINLAISQKTRDPTVKSQQVTDIERLDFWVGAIGENGSIPPEIAAKLDLFCYPPVV